MPVTRFSYFIVLYERREMDSLEPSLFPGLVSYDEPRMEQSTYFLRKLSLFDLFSQNERGDLD